MKRLFTFLAILISMGLAAQEGPKISSAIIDLDRNNDLAGAKKYIDEATEVIDRKDKSEVSEKDLSKYYYYNGLIHLRISVSDKPEVQALDSNALPKAAESFMNLLEFEEKTGKERYGDKAKEQLPILANQYAQRGLQKAQKGMHMKAYDDFLKTYEMKQQIGMGVDTSMYYNAALMAQNAGKLEKSLEIYKDLIEMGYKGIIFKAEQKETGQTVEFPSRRVMERAVQNGNVVNPRVEGDLRPDLYVNAANLHLATGDTAKYDAMVAEGRKKFPENEALLRAELQKFLETKQYDKAMVNLNQAIAQNPDNKLFYYIKGYILQTSMDSVTAAREAYKKSVEKDSTYLEPLYMLGLTYVDEANALSEEMNALPLDAQSKYKKLKQEQEQAFKNALPYFKKARKVAPDDMDTLNALKEVYYKLKMQEKAMEVQKEIDKRS